MNRGFCGRAWVVPTAVAFGGWMLAAGRSVGQTGCFVPGPTLATSSDPVAVTMGDFNGDGHADLAVANAAPNGVGLYLGDGAGGFSPLSVFDVGRPNNAIAAADFNHDGRLDLAVALSTLVPTGTDDLVILLGTGGGTFAPPRSFGLGTATSRPSASIAVADFNRDGNLDVALGHTNLNTVSIFLGNGAGSFSLAGSFSSSFQSLFSIAAGDFNGDGKADVVGTLDFANSVAVLLGTGTGALGPPTLFSAPPLPIGVAVGDLNGDGRPDLAVANEAGSVVSILLGTGLGGFGPATTFPVGFGSRAVTIADFNTDGRLDVAVANEFSGSVSVLLGDGTGRFGPTVNYAVGVFPRGLAAGDFDGDGLPDLAVANSGSNSVSILLNAAPAIVQASLPPGTVSVTYPPAQLVASGGTPPFTFALSGPPPAGLTFNPSTATFSGVPAQAGTSTFSVTVTDAGGCSSTHSYSILITRVLTVVALISSPNPSLLGQTIQLTATVGPSGPIAPTGNVEFHEGPVIGTAPLVNGVATLNISSLSLGTHVITAQYTGDANYIPNIVSTVLSQVVGIPEVPVLGGPGFAILALTLAAAALFLMRERG